MSQFRPPSARARFRGGNALDPHGGDGRVSFRHIDQHSLAPTDRPSHKCVSIKTIVPDTLMGLSERHTNAARPPGSPLAGRWPYLRAQKSHRIFPNFWPPKRACVDTSRSCGFRVASSLMFVDRRPCERHQWWSSLLHSLGSISGCEKVLSHPVNWIPWNLRGCFIGHLLDTVEPSRYRGPAGNSIAKKSHQN